MLYQAMIQNFKTPETFKRDASKFLCQKERLKKLLTIGLANSEEPFSNDLLTYSLPATS